MMFEREKERDKLEQTIIAATIENPEYAKTSSLRPECFKDKIFSKVWKTYQEKNIEPFNFIQLIDYSGISFDKASEILGQLSQVGDITSTNFSYYEEKLFEMWKKDLIRQKTEDYLDNKISETELKNVISTSIEQITKPVGYEMERILEAINTRPAPLRTGFKTLDRHIQFYPSDLIILKGDTKNGKTTFAMNLLSQQLKLKQTCLYVTFEIPTYDRFVPFMSALYTDTRYRNKEEEQKEVVTFLTEVGERLYLLPTPNREIPTLERIMQKATKIKRTSKLDFLFLDYDQLLTTERFFESEERRVSYIAQQLKLLANELKIVVILLSQVNKEGKTRWSAEKENTASAVLSIEKDPVNDIFQVWIPLNRYGPALIKDSAIQFNVNWNTRKIEENG